MGRGFGVRPIPRVRPFLAPAVACLVLLAGCSEEAAVDAAALEEDIAAALLPSAPEAVISVACSGAGDASPGDELDCVVVVDNQNLPVTVVFERNGVVAVTPEAALLRGVEAESQLATRFTEELGIPTTVSCAASLIVLESATTFECVATDDKGVARTLVVSVDDANQLVVGIS
jgi:hypothetical protein